MIWGIELSASEIFDYKLLTYSYGAGVLPAFTFLIIGFPLYVMKKKNFEKCKIFASQFCFLKIVINESRD